MTKSLKDMNEIFHQFQHVIPVNLIRGTWGMKQTTCIRWSLTLCNLPKLLSLAFFFFGRRVFRKQYTHKPILSYDSKLENSCGTGADRPGNGCAMWRLGLLPWWRFLRRGKEKSGGGTLPKEDLPVPGSFFCVSGQLLIERLDSSVFP